MAISVFSDTPLTLKGLQSSIRSSAPAELSAQMRNWLLAGPSFAEFEGLCRFLERADVRDALRKKLPAQKWAVIGGYTTRPIVAALRASLLAQGLYGEVFEASYNAFDVEILNDQSQLYQFQTSDVLVCTGHKSLRQTPDVGMDEEDAENQVRDEMTYFAARWDKLRNLTNARIHQHNFEYTPISCLGRLEQRYSWTQSRFIQELNRLFWLRDGKDIFVVDVAHLQQRVGTENWWSPKWYHHAKLGFNPECLADYGRLLHSHIAAVQGKTRKCLVVDLDNTLWRGIVGDDGVEGVGFGNGNASDEACLEFCRYIKRLGQSGVILGVVSKNEQAAAESMFNEHPEMPLKLADFAAFKANWRPKSENLRELARDLNIGLESIVFVDDNEAECAQVSREIPEVLVLQAEGESCDLAEQLDRLQLFDRMEFTTEDAERARSYNGLRIVDSQRKEASDLKGFLSGLSMFGQFGVPSESQTTRIAQLFAKTNQFNLTKEDFGVLELSEMPDRANRTCYMCQLSDRYARHGTISAIVVKQDALTVDISNWVMSCRVFNRTVEEFMMMSLVNELKQLGAATLRGSVVVLEKNKYVHDLFERLGFEFVSEDGNRRTYQLDLNRELNLTSYVARQNEDAVQETSRINWPPVPAQALA